MARCARPVRPGARCFGRARRRGAAALGRALARLAGALRPGGARAPRAGTNFLTRSCAFAAAGWSPTYTLTEDYALGLELKKRRWQCRYVNEYLAVGEAPEQVRNCFQQRSRWAKGCAPAW